MSNRRIVIETDGTKVNVALCEMSDLEMLVVGQMLARTADQRIAQAGTQKTPDPVQEVEPEPEQVDVEPDVKAEQPDLKVIPKGE